MDNWSNHKRLLTLEEKMELKLDHTHLFFHEIDLFLIAKSALNIAYTLTESSFKTHLLDCLKCLQNSLEAGLNLITIDEDYYPYESFTRKLSNFVNIFALDSDQPSYQKKDEFFQVLLDTFHQLPVVDFGELTLSSFVT
ncbi:hypothetical protein [Staphylococcus simulans]|uniref:Uncharacterized protein n=1 Tax=Staphylococcus simulans TaxID=1286 RepID=A0A6N2YK98_STASI